MNLIDFVKYLGSSEKITQYMSEYYADIDYYDAEVYLKNSLSVESELAIFDGDKIEGMIEMHVNNEQYYNLFSLDLLVEVYEDYSSPTETDYEIAERIINYRINDA